MAAIGNGSSDTVGSNQRRRAGVMGAAAVTALVLALLVVSGAEAAPSFTLSTTSPANSATLAGSVNWQVVYVGATPSRVSFYVDGALQATDDAAPFLYELDTTKMGNASHLLKAIGAKGKFSTQTQVSVTVSNAAVTSSGSAPLNAGLPVISGTASVGQALTGSVGSWSGSPNSFAYEWHRCDIAGLNCAPIAGAAGATYTLASADAGDTIRVAITATNAYGQTTATSEPTAVVQSAVLDATPPTTPTALLRSAASATTIGLAWSPSSDNVGVSGYSLYVNGDRVGTASANSATVGGLACSNAYVLAVEAFDAAGNVSGRTVLTTLTAACASGAALRVGSTITAHRICSGCATTYAGDLSRYGYVILHADQYSQVTTLKAKSPSLKMLVYKNALQTCSYDTSGGADNSELTTGVGYYEALNQHPEWFLLDTTGSRITLADYPSCWMMDWGSPSYQRRWAQNVIADAKAHGWDGVLIDDVNWSEYTHLSSGQTIAKYPANSDQTESMRQFLAAVGPELQKAGLLALPNIFVDYPDGPTIFSQWLSYASGAYQEYWSKSGNFSTTCCNYTGTSWDYHQSFFRIAEQANKLYLPVTKAASTDTRSMEYARANFYLDWDGGPSSLSFDPKFADPWSPYWTTDLGMPLGPKFQVGTAWRRNYERGAVVVNPSSSAAVIDLGSTFRRIDGSSVTSVTLDPATAAVLLAG